MSTAVALLCRVARRRVERGEDSFHRPGLPDAAKQADPVEGISVAGFQHLAASAGQLHTGIITATVIEMNPTEELMIEPAVTSLSLLPIYFLQSQHFR